jgi:hypothetical protein
MVVIDIGPVHSTRPHLFADAIETQVLFGGEGPFSEADALSLLNQSPPADDEVIDKLEDDQDDDNEADALSTGEITESKQKKIDAAFAQFQFRVKVFGDAYPFEIDENRNLSLRKAPTIGAATYAFLLCCARLRSFGDKRAQTFLADKFEELCAISLRGLFVDHAEIIRFGPNSPDRVALGTSMKDAIPKLAEKIGVAISPYWNDNDETPQGDGGIDIIALVALDGQADARSERWTLVAQCASYERSAGWEKKVNEAHRGLTKRLQFQHPPSNALFIPGAYRKTDGTWPDATKDKGVMLMDRVRIIHNIQALDDADSRCWNWLNEADGRSLDLGSLSRLL